MKNHSPMVPLPVLVFFHVSSVLGGIGPSFELQECAWNATDIVLVSAETKLDGSFTVLETLLGDSKPDSVIRVPELAALADEKQREISGRPGKAANNGSAHITCKRMVLFLRRAGTAQPAGRGPKLPQPSGDWGASTWGGMTTSAVWFEEGQTYAFQQVMNPGPTLLVSFHMSEQEFRNKLAAILKTQNELRGIITMPDLAQRARSLRQFVSSDYWYVRQAAMEAYGNCGTAGLPILREILNDNSLSGIHAGALNAFVAAGGNDIGKELTEMFAEEKAFWKERGPTLAVGWWGNDNGPLRNRYCRTLEVLRGLKKLHFSGCHDIVQQFGDFWRSLPQLEDRSGLSQMSQACDDVIKELNRE